MLRPRFIRMSLTPRIRVRSRAFRTHENNETRLTGEN